MYLLDSNIYINFYDRYYREAFFPTFWSKFANILNASVEIPKIIVSENYQDVWFKNWLQANYTKQLIDHKFYVTEWVDVIKHIQNNPCYKDAALTSEKGWANDTIADPWLIAIAKKHSYVIVTDEVKNVNLNPVNPSKSAKIPDVCEQLGIRCISMNQFFQEISLSV